ncbi:MAG: hypothetical protein ACLQOO_15130 [Terriglobia bacterium]
MADRILEILDDEDIEGLIALGAPLDEYEREAELIAAAMGDSGSTEPGASVLRDEAKAIIRRVWGERFGPFSDEDLATRDLAFERVAAKVVRLLFPQPC